MLENITDETSKGYNEKNMIHNNKNNGRGGIFPAKNIFVADFKKISTPVTVPKHWLGSSFIPLEYYELDMNFDETEMKIKSDHSSNDKVKLSHKNIVVIEE